MDEHEHTVRTVVDALTTTWRALSELGATLSEQQWKLPSDLPGWSVQDIFAHLVGTERVLQGMPGAPAPPGPPPAHVHNPMGELNEAEVVARRDLPGVAVLAEWDALVAVRADTLASADPDYFDRPVMTPAGPGTMLDFLSIRVLDCWVHEQDLRRALGLPPAPAGPAAEHAVDRLTRSLPMVVAKRAQCPDGGAVAVGITGPVTRDLSIEVTGGRARFVDALAVPPTARLTMDTETFIRLATGRRADDLAGRVGVDGDAGLARRVVASLNVMI